MGIPSGNTRVFEVTPPPSDSEDSLDTDYYLTDDEVADKVTAFLDKSNDSSGDDSACQENPDQDGINWDRLCVTWLLLNNMQMLDMNSLNTALLEPDELDKMHTHCEHLLHQMGAALDPDTSMLAWPNLDVGRFVLAHDLLHALVQWNSGPFCDFFTQPGCSLEALTDLAIFLADCGLTMYVHHGTGCSTRRLCVRVGGPRFQDRRPQYRLVSPQKTEE